MVRLIPGAQALEDLERLVLRWFSNEHLRKTALECWIFFNVLAVLIERCRTDALNLAPGEWWLQDIGSVDRALRSSCANKRVELVNEQDRIACRAQLFEHLLESLFKFTAVLRSSDERAHVKCDDALVEQRRRNVALNDALREPFSDGGLADAWLAN